MTTLPAPSVADPAARVRAPRAFPPDPRARPGPWLLAIVLLGAALRLWLVGDKSFWLDEAFSVDLASQPWGELVRVLSEREANMGIYYLLLRPWLRLGDTEAVVRTLSVLASVATLPVVYALGRRLHGVGVALTATLLLAVNAMAVRYAQEARGYSLAVLFSALASLFFVHLVRRPSRAGWLGYVTSGALAVYGHLFGGLVLAAQAASLAALQPRQVPWRWLLAAGVAIAALTAPLTGFLLFGAKDQVAWIPEPDAWVAAQVLWSLGGMGAEVLPYLALVGIAAGAGIGAWRVYGRSVASWRYALPVLWLALPVLVAYVVSQVKPILVERYLLVCLPAFVLLAAAGLARLPAGRGRALAFAGVLTLATSGLVLYFAGFQKEEWRGVTRFVLERARPGDALLFYPPYVRRPFEYYRERWPVPREEPEVVFPSPDYGLDRPDEAFLESVARRHSRVWVILSHVPAVERSRGTVRRIDEALRREKPVVRSERFQGVEALLYEPGR